MNEASKKSGIRRGLKKPWLLALIALAVVSSVIFLMGSGREPKYKNKPISYWVNGACCAYPTSAGDGTPTYEFQQEVRKIGLPAIPYLEKKLQTGDFLRKWERRVWDKLPDEIMLRFAEPLSGREIREGAAATLAVFGPQAKSAVPYLVQRLGAKSHEAWQAAATLGAIGPDAEEAVPALKLAIIKATNSDIFYSQTEMAWAIWKIDHETNFVVEDCCQRIIHDPDHELNAVNLLGEMGSAAQSTVPLLIQLLNDKKRTPDIRVCAAYALGNIDFKSDPVIAALVRGSADSNEEVSGSSSVMLWQLNSRQYAGAVAPNVLKYAAYLGWDTFLHFAAANHLDIEPALPALRELVKSDSPPVRKLAEDALKELDSSAIKEVSSK